MIVLAVVSAKGGVGKTTLCANLAAVLRRNGRRVLAVDLDPQDALRLHLGMGPAAPATATSQIPDSLASCGDSSPWVSAISVTADDVYVLPYGAVEEDTREALEAEMSKDPGWVRKRLDSLGLPDDAIVLLDTPPGRSIYMTQALTAADMAVVVTLADAASYATLPTMHALIGRYCSPRPAFIDYVHVINQVDRSRQLSKDVADLMRADLGDRLVGIVHQDQAIPESLAFNRCVLDYDEHSRGSHDLMACAQRITSKLAAAGVPA